MTVCKKKIVKMDAFKKYCMKNTEYIERTGISIQRKRVYLCVCQKKVEINENILLKTNDFFMILSRISNFEKYPITVI